MDPARKRKASTATPIAAEGSASGSKRIKLLNSNAPPSSTESAVQKVGFKLLKQLSNATDKTGRSITGPFLELPPREEHVDYYKQIKLPVAIDTIEEKLQKNAYPTITTLESDMKRMIQNAKEYNMPKSDIYEDAERIRKLVYNFMKINNPAYQLDSTYSAFPTPIPTDIHAVTNGTIIQETVKDEPKSRDVSTRPRTSTMPKDSEPLSERKSSMAPSATTGGVEVSQDMDFTGKSFQDAQQMIVAELIRYTDEEGLEIFTPFTHLPSRKLEDYYKVIKRPVSLKSVQKRTRGEHGRNPPTGVTDFKTWDTFEDEVSYIWRNAKHYNEDGSEMYNLASELEDIFRSRLGEAKEKVEEPAKPSIKLGGPKAASAKSGITLNLTQHRGSPAPGVSVDNEALARQRQMVQAGVSGQQAQPQGTLANGGPRQTSQASLDPSIMPAGNPPTSAVKAEKYTTLSPAPTTSSAPTSHATTNGMMPPPETRLPNGSPFLPPQQHHQMPLNNYHFTASSLLPPTYIRAYSTSKALLPVVTISTHPQLRLQKPYALRIPPHATLSHQNTTITLPSTHYYLQIAPTISRELSMGRAYKMFVTVNGARLTQRDTVFHADSGKRTHMYEGSLSPGVNRIEVEVAAAKLDSVDGKGLDVEKVTVFANLTRQ